MVADELLGTCLSAGLDWAGFERLSFWLQRVVQLRCQPRKRLSKCSTCEICVSADVVYVVSVVSEVCPALTVNVGVCLSVGSRDKGPRAVYSPQLSNHPGVYGLDRIRLDGARLIPLAG